MPMNLEQIWEKAVLFHGGACPALAVGARATAYVAERLSEPFEVVCTAESFSCAIDAIQATLGCTIGNGRLRVRSLRRMAFRFCDVGTGQGVYLAMRPFFKDRPGLTERILEMPVDQLFSISTADETPERAPNCILSSACPVRNPREEKRACIAPPNGV